MDRTQTNVRSAEFRDAALTVLNGVQAAWDKAKAAGEEAYFGTMLSEAIDDFCWYDDEREACGPTEIWTQVAMVPLFWNLWEAYDVTGCPAEYELSQRD